MTRSYFFYDLETSGLSARDDRIMQFAGIRTNEAFEQIGEPYDILVKLNDDTLPSPDALLVTGIMPQKTLEDGYTEAEFCKILTKEVFTPGTCMVGFNNVRFDDEFIRHILWRNFYDPYEWSWKDGRSRWDMLDVVRMTRALRPDGINWPVDASGKATNRLELLTKENGLEHEKAHDALSDVVALIAVTRMICDKNPQLFNYLYAMRMKKEVMQLVNLDIKQPFIYVSGRYDAAYNKATIAFPLTSAPNSNVLVYDLRYDPEPFVDLSEKELAKKIYATWEERKAEGFEALPVKPLQYNRCPAVAPVGVLTQANGWEKLALTPEVIEKHRDILLKNPQFAERLRVLYEQKPEYKKSSDPEAQLYDGFLQDRDRVRVEAVRNASERELVDFHPEFHDERLPELLLHYKARNYPSSLSEAEQATWEAWRSTRIHAKLGAYIARLSQLSQRGVDEFALEEMKLWAESIMPSDVSDAQ